MAVIPLFSIKNVPGTQQDFHMAVGARLQQEVDQLSLIRFYYGLLHG
jgi:hypothetical protein